MLRIFTDLGMKQILFFLSYILLVLKSGPTVLILREIIYRYKMAIASGDVGDN